MAATIDMKLVRVGSYVFKQRPETLEEFLALHPDAEVLGGYETKADQPVNNPVPGDGFAIPVAVVELLADAGYETPELVASASDDELVAINGIGKKTLEMIRASFESDD